MPEPNPSPSFIVWNGEWPLVRSTARQIREFIAGGVDSVNQVFDIPYYLTLAREAAVDADRRVTSTTEEFSKRVFRGQATSSKVQQYFLPTCGVLAVSTYVLTKSMPWGLRIAFRNGAVTAAALVVLCFPREIAVTADRYLPFSTAPYKANKVE
ncbi:hypothetical protein, conserved [Angomonas deanei]|uniref:Uncharacterized protein n=1 Tax=Angomonas deanei TaxID=59799 RepID=A0A7G2CU91_9TRYP|nr:hypothetical protein, conserved [Angomonas deanei]